MARRHVERKIRLLDPGAIGKSEESSLKQLVCDLATVLLPLGVTPRLLSDLSREAFVRAAAATARLRNGKINQSRVSAQTGLTRAYVRQVLRGRSRHPTAARGRTPIELVTNGWKSDRALTSPSGKPKALPINGPGPSFFALAETYSPDVPYRALLCELERKGIAIVKDGQVRLRSSKTKGQSPVLTLKARGRVPGGAIHRFTFSRGEGTDPRIIRGEFRRLANLLSSLKHMLDAKDGLLRTGKRRDRDALVVLTLILSQAERPCVTPARQADDLTR